jgi:hypothetical protein
MQYRKKPIAVDARLITESEVVLTAHGRVRAEPGDWVLCDPNTGDTWPIKPDLFEATYEPVESTDGEAGLERPGEADEGADEGAKRPG